jgi:hypothetical protein
MSIQIDPSGLFRPSIPQIHCPRCGTHMRLASAEAASRAVDKMVFDCECGLEYQMATAGARAQANSA